MPLHAHDVDSDLLRMWALVLEARFVPFRVDKEGLREQLLVPSEFMDVAREELRLFEEENRDWPPSLTPVRQQERNTLATACILLLLATFHNVTLLQIPIPGKGIVEWFAAGSARSGDIVNYGEWWRAVTALTLHSGVVHLSSNLLIGGWMMVLLGREVGSGAAWAVALGSGFLGNMANSYAQLPTHSAVGASTAVFGVVGALAVLNMVRHRRVPRRWMVPVAGGLALLASLGTEGVNTDIGAHFFGCIAGAVLGLLVAPFGRVPRWLNAVLAVGAVAVVLVAWRLAIISFN